MAIQTSEEKKQKIDKIKELKNTMKKFKDDYLSSLFLGIKMGGIALVGVIVIYFALKWIFHWDLFYETELKYSTIFFFLAIIFLIIVFLCIIVAIILFNTKHKRNTKYKMSENDNGG